MQNLPKKPPKQKTITIGLNKPRDIWGSLLRRYLKGTYDKPEPKHRNLYDTFDKIVDSVLRRAQKMSEEKGEPYEKSLRYCIKGAFIGFYLTLTRQTRRAWEKKARPSLKETKEKYDSSR